MKLAVAQGPLAVSINANGRGFTQYKTGVYSGEADCQGGSNHAVVVCGYGTDSVTRKQYWMVKNSWGKDFGDNGYIKFELGKNVCGIEEEATYPLLDMTKKTDASSMCVNDKACRSDADCNAVATSCRSGKCLCQPCQKNNVCQTDAECGGKVGACIAGGENGMFLRQVSANKNYCDCRDVIPCKQDRKCTSAAQCGNKKCDNFGWSSNGVPFKSCKC